MGSCVDNARIVPVCGLLANALWVDISALPVTSVRVVIKLLFARKGRERWLNMQTILGKFIA